jgi:hypothetical protein
LNEGVLNVTSQDTLSCKSKVKCHNYGKDGHISKNCFDKKKVYEDKEAEASEEANKAREPKEENEENETTDLFYKRLGNASLKQMNKWASAAKEESILRSFINDLKMKTGVLGITTICKANQGAIKLSLKPIQHQWIKHIGIQYHYTGESISKRKLKVEYLRIEEMTADICAKPLLQVCLKDIETICDCCH